MTVSRNGLLLSSKRMNMYCVCVFVFTDVFVAVCCVITVLYSTIPGTVLIIDEVYTIPIV